MKKHLLIILAIIPVLAFAQEKNDNSKYLGNVVPVVNGKVVFTREVNAPGMSQDDIYNALSLWTDSRFITNDKTAGRVLLADKEKGMIACKGDEYIVFVDKALSLDRARINYRMTFECAPGKCSMEISSISYLYEGVKERITAEEWITDENAVNKKRTRLYRNTGKFRIKTVDLADELFNEAQKALGVNASAAVQTTTTVAANISSATPIATVSTPIVTQAAPAISSGSGSLEGYRSIAPGQIPGNIIKLLSESWSLITAGNDSKFNMMTASWGGLGFLYNQPVSFCFINPSRYTYQLMEQGDYYTISFYTETYRDALNYCGKASGKSGDKVAGSGLTPITTPSGSKAFSEAWMIIECQKFVSQPMSWEGMNDETLKKNWEGKDTHKMYIGKILNVWVK